MDLLVLACSPRKNGNSDTIAEWVRAEANDRGGSAEVIHLRDYRYSGCVECNACYKDGICCVQDDMQILYPKLLQAKRIVVVSPVFFYSYSGQAKSFIDRLQCFWSRKFLLNEPVIDNEAFRSERQTISFFCGGTNFSDTFQCMEKITKNFNLFIESKYIKSYNFPSIDAAGDIANDPKNKKIVAAAIDDFCFALSE